MLYGQIGFFKYSISLVKFDSLNSDNPEIKWRNLMPPRVIIADDNPIFREALKNLLESSNMEIIGECGNGLETIQTVQKLSPDLLLLDISMPYFNGMDVLNILRKNYPNLKIIMLTMDSYLSKQAIEAGANGYCTKICSPHHLIEGIKKVLKGETFVYAE